VSILDELKELDEKRAKLVYTAKTKALDQINEAVLQLEQLGFLYRIVEGDEKAPNAKSQKKGRKKGPCPICKFMTDPQHDGRLNVHREQPEKKALSDKQLKDLGLTKIDAE
jgi:hypothetical protein